MPIDPVALTRQLVDIESISENEAAVGHFLSTYLTALGFQVEKTPVPHSAGRERFNVYAGISADPPDVVLSTHIDTVPPFIPSSEDETYIYGRGSCDAKGIVAAQVAAAERLRDLGVRVGLLFLAGEERGSHGAKIANLKPKGSRFLINGEPTDNRLALASKGALNVTIRAHGKMGHSAYPELGDSAIHKLVPALDRMLRITLPSDPDAGPSTMNIGLIEGGHAPNVIADEASATLLIRLVGPSDEIRSALQQAAGDDAEVDVTLEIPFQKLKRIEGLPTMVAAFTTDIPALSNWGEPLLLGPGSIHVAHTPNERLSKQEQRDAIDLYTQIAHRLVQ
jgi:acetylornithine deacetylase